MFPELKELNSGIPFFMASRGRNEKVVIAEVFVKALVVSIW